VIAPSRRPPKRRAVSFRLVAAVAALAAAVILFALGIALGEALKDNPKPHLTVTISKTIVP
jgi:hypothetical protein